jgi:hypothetical protein
VGTKIVRACDFGPADRREDRSGPQLSVTGLLAAGAGDEVLFGGRFGEAQQLSERSGTGLMHSRAHRHLNSLQIHPATVSPVAEKNVQ